MRKQNQELLLLNLLKSVLPKAVPDAKLADQIYTALEKEITAKERTASFEKFCAKAELADLREDSIAQVIEQFESSFGKGNVNIVPHSGKKAASVEVITPQGTFEGVIKVNPDAKNGEGEENGDKPKFTAFPVALESDPEVVWMLGRDERLTPDDAAISLAKVQDSFWESKAGQQHLRKRTERTFPEFLAKVPGKVLTEAGLKRHYKEGEPLKQIKLLKPRKTE
jgi:hypothetical protein